MLIEDVLFPPQAAPDIAAIPEWLKPPTRTTLGDAPLTRLVINENDLYVSLTISFTQFLSS